MVLCACFTMRYIVQIAISVNILPCLVDGNQSEIQHVCAVGDQRRPN